MRKTTILAALCSILSACSFFATPDKPHGGGGLKPTGHSIEKYVSILVTDNRTSYSKYGLSSDFARTHDGFNLHQDTPECSVPAIQRAISRNIQFFSVKMFPTYDGITVCSRTDNVKNTCDTGGQDIFITGQLFEDLRKYTMTCGGKRVEGTVIPTITEVLSAARGKIFPILDMTSQVNWTKVLPIIDSLVMSDEILFYFGSLDTGENPRDSTAAWKQYRLVADALPAVMPLFEVSSEQSIEFLHDKDIPRVPVLLVEPSLVGAAHNYSFGVMKNLCPYDNDIISGNVSSIEAAKSNKFDFFHSGVADMEAFR